MCCAACLESFQAAVLPSFANRCATTTPGRKEATRRLSYLAKADTLHGVGGHDVGEVVRAHVVGEVERESGVLQAVQFVSQAVQFVSSEETGFCAAPKANACSFFLLLFSCRELLLLAYGWVVQPVRGGRAAPAAVDPSHFSRLNPVWAPQGAP
jgi:hypothetical protein